MSVKTLTPTASLFNESTSPELEIHPEGIGGGYVNLNLRGAEDGVNVCLQSGKQTITRADAFCIYEYLENVLGITRPDAVPATLEAVAAPTVKIDVKVSLD